MILEVEEEGVNVDVGKRSSRIIRFTLATGGNLPFVWVVPLELAGSTFFLIGRHNMQHSSGEGAERVWEGAERVSVS